MIFKEAAQEYSTTANRTQAYKQLLDGHAGGKVVVRMEYDTGIDL